MQKAGVADFEACERSHIHLCSKNNFILLPFKSLIISTTKISTNKQMNVQSCLAISSFVFKIPFCKMKPFFPVHLMCTHYTSFIKLLSNAPYAFCSSIFPKSKEKKYLNCREHTKLLKINICRHFVSVLIYMLNTVDNDLKHVSQFDI